MEKKGNNSLIIVLALLLIGVGGYILYNKNISKNTTNNEENNTKTTEVETKKETQQATQIINTKVGTFIINKDGSVYYRKTVDKYAGAEIVIDDNNSIGTHGNFELEDYVTGLNPDAESQESREIHTFEGYKLDLQNINSAYEIMVGNGGSSEIIYFLSKDGKVNELSFHSNGTSISINLKKDTSSYTDIVSVLQSSDFDAQKVILVDKYGNKYTEYKK